MNCLCVCAFKIGDVFAERKQNRSVFVASVNRSWPTSENLPKTECTYDPRVEKCIPTSYKGHRFN